MNNPNGSGSNPNKDDFERMVQLAEFGAKRHDERRQVEFRVFISYNTLLVLAFYHIGKIEELKAPWWVTFGLGIIHIAYLLWQIRLSIALVNDASRRNFYLKKAECILHHLREKPGDRFHPRPDRSVTLDRYGTRDNEISEYELFYMYEPDIVLVPKMWECWKHWIQIFKDWSRLFQTVIPTVMLISLMGKLVGERWTTDIICIFVNIIYIFISFEKVLPIIKRKHT